MRRRSLRSRQRSAPPRRPRIENLGELPPVVAGVRVYEPEWPGTTCPACGRTATAMTRIAELQTVHNAGVLALSRFRYADAATMLRRCTSALRPTPGAGGEEPAAALRTAPLDEAVIAPNAAVARAQLLCLAAGRGPRQRLDLT